MNNISKKVWVILFLLSLPFSTSYAQLATYMEADLVLGQPDFTSNAAGIAANTLWNPTAVAIDPTTGKVFVADYGNHRVLRYASVDALSNGEPAELVLGQPDFGSNTGNRGGAPDANTMYNPYGIALDSEGNLFVSETSNNRILRFNNASSISSNGANADGVLGQVAFNTNGDAKTRNQLNSPRGIFVDKEDRLWVCERYNHRVLWFNNAKDKGNGADADGVLGQDDFNSNVLATDQNSLKQPYTLWVTDDGTLYVCDHSNHRVMIWDDVFTKIAGGTLNQAVGANSGNADRVIGQANFDDFGSGTTQNKFNYPIGVVVDMDDRLYVSEYWNNRILVFENASSINGLVNASYVLGKDIYDNNQSNYPSGTPTAKNLYNWNGGMFFNENTNYLWIADDKNHRVLKYTISADPPTFANTYAKLLNTTSTTSDLAVKSIDEEGLVYYVVLSAGSTPPSNTQVKNGQDANGNNVASNRKGTITIAAINTEYTSTITGLTPNQGYDIFLVRSSSSGTNLADVETIRVQTSQKALDEDEEITAGDTGKKIIATVTNNNGDATNNYLAVYTVGTGNNGLGNVPTGENVPAGVTQRIDFLWGVDETGSVTADVIFDYSNIPGLTNAQELRLLKRNDANDDWIDITHLAFHDRENKRFILYNQSSFSEFTVGAIPGAGGFAFTNNYPDISDIGGPSVTLTSNLTQAGNVYYLIVEQGNAAPTKSQIKNPSTYSDSYASSGSRSGLVAGTNYADEATGLASSKSYTVYMYAEKSDLSTSTSTAQTNINTGNGVPVSDWIIPGVLLLMIAAYSLRRRVFA